MASAVTYDFSPTVQAAPEAAVSDYFALMKPKVMSLVVFTGFVGMWIAPGLTQLHPFLAAVAMLCLAINAGAAGAINMALEGDIDAVMRRTSARPIPTGKIASAEAMALGVTLSLASFMVMGLSLNWMAAGLLAAANLFYVLVYTLWLKRRTPQNIVIGGAAGAFPPLVGWAAVTGDVALYPLILFMIIFFWTPPHFWALSLFANEDYKRANIPMMSVVAGPRATKIQMVIYAAILLPITLAPWALGFASLRYGVIAAVLSGFFLFTALRVLMSEDLKHAKLMFGYSVFYLFALFLAAMMG